LVPDNHGRSHKGKLIIIVAATISGALLLLAAAACCCLLMKKGRRKREGDDQASSLPPSATTTGDFVLPYRPRNQPALSPGRVQQKPDEGSDGMRYAEKDVDLPLFDLEVILVATDNFAEHKKIGAGGFGPVYMVITNRAAE
jgi:hypothetical protein